MDMQTFEAFLKILPIERVKEYQAAANKEIHRRNPTQATAFSAGEWSSELVSKYKESIVNVSLQEQFDLVFGDNRDKTE